MQEYQLRLENIKGEPMFIYQTMSLPSRRLSQSKISLTKDMKFGGG